MARVLVIDDQKDVRTVMRMVLKVNRFDVVEAESAAEGLAAFGEQTFDLVMVDIYLDDASGFDVIANLRGRAPALPVIAVSGLTSLDDAPAGLMDHVVHLRKPFRPSELLMAVAEAQELARAIPQTQQRIAV